jgi:hypothetical protein
VCLHTSHYETFLFCRFLARSPFCTVAHRDPRLTRHACVTASLIARGPGRILVTAQKLDHTVEDHTSHHEPFLLSVPCKITFPYGGPQRPTVGVVCMCNGVTNGMSAWDDPGHSTKAGSHRGRPHFTPRDIPVVCQM